MRLPSSLLLLSTLAVAVDAKSSWQQIRSTIVPNFSNLFGSARVTAKTPYERIGNHPVFQVTTAWGAPYMSFERVEDTTNNAKDVEAGQNLLGYGGDMRPVTLFYMDPEDALQMHQEMKQMQNMQKSDIRITATTLSKAIRQASNFGDGLPTGQPVDPLTGKLPSIQDGGSLRYKIVPSRRQLFYAASRCQGRERVGMFGDTPVEDATTVLDGSAAIDAMNQQRRRNVRNGKSSAMTASQRRYRHMEGYSGIPVFYCAAMRKSQSTIKGLLGGTKEENPLFFSYEDLRDAYNKMRKKNPKAPASPPNVEVYNLMDVLTSMDREQGEDNRWNTKMVQRFLAGSASKLDCLSFIPASAAVDYKGDLAKRGNGKSRLRPMRDWGPRSA